MGDEGRHNGEVHRDEVPHCPVCGAVLDARLLDLEDEDAPTSETLLLLDCPQGHVHATLTHADIIVVLSAEVLERLRR